MVGRSMIQVAMKMSADVYKQENTQDADTGAIRRHWEFDHTERCFVEPTKSDGSSTKTDGKSFGQSINGYSETFQVRAKFNKPLSKRWRITNVTSSNGISIFNEMDKLSNPPMIFEVISCHAMLDPFGRLSHYDVTLERVNIQNNDS
jgi:hypothetical protein